ncbi:MAG: DUF4097 family beta strand repeat protein [Verrucomicrobia bacterium]|nr:DUF4097 family beta strand repeat protein [Verrucomicrobiota bacterium]
MKFRIFSICLTALPLFGATFYPKEATELVLDLQQATVEVEGSQTGKLRVNVEPTLISPQHYRKKGEEEQIYFTSTATHEKWVVDLGQEVPVDLRLDLSEGKVDVKLNETNLRTLLIDCNRGEVNVSGDGSLLEKVHLLQNEGTIALHLRNETSPLEDLSLEGGQGNLQLSLLGAFPSLQRISMEGGAGELQANFAAQFKELEELLFKTTSGNLTLNFISTWEIGAHFAIESTRGNISIALPQELGVLVRCSTATGTIVEQGLISTEQGFVNQAYGTSPITLELEVKTLSGNIGLVVQPLSSQSP